MSSAPVRRAGGVSFTSIVDVAGAHMGGAARFKAELDRYLVRTGRDDVRVIGTSRRVDAAWLFRREITEPWRGRRVALNNVGFVGAGGERWTLLRNALHFLTEQEMLQLDPSVRASMRREAPIVRLAARRSDVLVAPSTAMAERVARTIPRVQDRLRIRAHPVSSDTFPGLPRDPAILCPILFSPYKQMDYRLAEMLVVLDDLADPCVKLRVTAERNEVSTEVAGHPRTELVGRLGHDELCRLSAGSRAIYFPTSIESFGYPLAEARATGQPVIALATAQNREIAGRALCGFVSGDAESLHSAVKLALSAEVAPDPAPFDPDAYFDWILGCPP